MEAESDDETIEFDIEVVESSSSTSLPTESIDDLHSSSSCGSITNGQQNQNQSTNTSQTIPSNQQDIHEESVTNEPTEFTSDLSKEIDNFTIETLPETSNSEKEQSSHDVEDLELSNLVPLETNQELEAPTFEVAETDNSDSGSECKDETSRDLPDPKESLSEGSILNLDLDSNIRHPENDQDLNKTSNASPLSELGKTLSYCEDPVVEETPPLLEIEPLNEEIQSVDVNEELELLEPAKTKILFSSPDSLSSDQQVEDIRRECVQVEIDVPSESNQNIIIDVDSSPRNSIAALGEHGGEETTTITVSPVIEDSDSKNLKGLAAKLDALTQPDPISPTEPSEDLEWEFDNEPPFEKRHVQVKRNQNPRDLYELGEELGRGKFGTVYRCMEQQSRRMLAAKFVHMRRREDREDVEREIEIMSLLQHKRLLQLYDAFDDGMMEMCLITELVEGGELFERIVDDDFELTEKKAAIFMRQICEGVEYMHSEKIVHLDMKPENILCASKTSNRIKLIDFGLARRLNTDEPLRVMFGTPDFAAPEVLAYDTVSLATDMWSVGVICYVLLSGLSPFMGDNDMETMANVTRATYDFDDGSFEPISDLAKDFISKLLVKEQLKRMRPSECLQHPWLQRGGFELEASMRSRRSSMVAPPGPVPEVDTSSGMAGLGTPPLLVSLDKRNLKKYVVRRKWHKTVHAIMALGRMGANLNL